jgi:hypothetical protein
MSNWSRKARSRRNKRLWAEGRRWDANSASPSAALRADKELTGQQSAYDREDDVGLAEFARVNGSSLARPCGCSRAWPERRLHFYRHGTVVICLMCGHIYLGEAARAREYQRKLSVR